MQNRINISGLLIAVFAIACVLCGCDRHNEAQTPPQREQPAYEGTIVAVGDSLTAGLGVNEDDAYPALLEKKLRAAGYPWRVVNAGISGETSSGTLSRVNWILKLKPDIVILETGANDGLRGVDTRVTRRNIDETINLFRKSGVIVVLAGMRMVRNLGPEFTASFGAVYTGLARKHDLILIPFFLEGVAGEPTLNQADGIHPTPEGYGIIAETVYPSVRKAIDRKKSQQQLERTP
jgi:acyl-CoA thioesterase-1